MRIGQTSGHGRYGILDDDGTTVLCHECGRRFKSIAAHVVRTHGIPARTYKVAHGLPLGQALCSAAVSERMSASMRRVQDADYMREIATKVDQRAAAARRRETLAEHRAAFTSGVRAQRRFLARRAEIHTCPGCGAQWCNLDRADQPRVTCSEECRIATIAARRKLTPRQRRERDAAIVERVAAGEHVAAVSREFGLTTRSVRAIVANRHADRR